MSTATGVSLLLGSFTFLPLANADTSMVEEGKQLAFHRQKGNCLACHKIQGGAMPGNIGPELVNMKARYPDKAVLRAQIWDATINNPNPIRPPYGKHKVLSEKDVDKVVEFIYTL
jgi:sulfur-oxidizing protein SoxX